MWVENLSAKRYANALEGRLLVKWILWKGNQPLEKPYSTSQLDALTFLKGR